MPSLVTVYGQRTLLGPRHGVIAISQSGQSPDLVATLEAATAQGAATLTMTNHPDSPLAGASRHTFDLACGPEQAVAATKSYTASLAALAALSQQLTPAPSPIPINRLTATIEDVQNQPVPVDASRLLAAVDRCVVVGRGYNLATAHEAALKLQELTGITAQPFSPADLAHGPIAALGPTVPLIVIATGDAAADSIDQVITDAHRRNTPVVVIGDEEHLLAHADIAMHVPSAPADWLSPLPAIIPLQRLAIAVAAQRGLDLDQPHGLRKVTETR